MANNAKQNILNKIKRALAKPVPVPFAESQGKHSVFIPLSKELELEFAERFTRLEGRFSYCENLTELVEQLQTLFKARNWTKIFCSETALKQSLQNAGLLLTYVTDLASCEAAITGCEALIARTGTIVLSSKQESGRTVSVYAPVHICIAKADQLVYDIEEGLQQIRENDAPNLPSMITLATGPSRTADIEKTLVVGVHGPKEVICFLLDNL